ncbi:alpha-ketoacid dehydrogenase kinase [Coccomyxa subellipsoidea C-169]|uniref:Protein-serine/threonine kinase n=1 Tax=Coccomyxa subellipsoidea (strain C-169) TaxID=574566 RepID=I0Z077_COCSC|nr:alpha-ketoacid dehydrogenase kinase [Coccomyxa subellipsoidea C-169]EIE24046.1 alpha-ketoacid dehydrogenase kinase [Coccomyxa subellipsoidea C-169]|eukprot:XP_005648590.1 alpha-ketoacid dehydrogenase kinase [Coccomyxa subellipsoidea C-169]
MAFVCNSVCRLWRSRISPSRISCHDVISSTSLEQCLLRTVWSDAPSTETLPGERFYDSTIEKYALQDIEALSLQQMLEFGRAALFNESKILTSARHAQRELPKRLARRLMDLQFLPYIVVTNPHIKRVYDAYYHAFNTLRNMPQVQTAADNDKLTQVLQRLVDEHAPMLDALAAGFRECKMKPIVGPKLQMDNFLDSMLRSRISRRVMAEQHIHLALRRPGYIGIICTDLSLPDAISFAAQRTKQVCTETFGAAPEVLISGTSAQLATMPYIPTHLDYMLYELLKNAMRAVVLSHRGRPLPALTVAICKAQSSVTLRISDQGGGIPDDQLDKVFQYGFTTVGAEDASMPVEGHFVRISCGLQESQSQEGINMWSHMTERSASPGGPWRMGGLGFGLPLSRLYARYFGGDLRLVSMPGYGTDAYLSIQDLEGDWEEQRVEPQIATVGNESTLLPSS